MIISKKNPKIKNCKNTLDEEYNYMKYLVDNMKTEETSIKKPHYKLLLKKKVIHLNNKTYSD